MRKPPPVTAMTSSIASHPALVTGACSLVSVRAIQQGIKAVKRFLGCDVPDVFPCIAEKYANTTTTSHFLVLHDSMLQNKMQAGDNILLISGDLGMLNAIQVLDAMIKSGEAQVGMVIASEINSDRRPDSSYPYPTSGAALPLTLQSAWGGPRLSPGKKGLLLACGSGITAGADIYCF